jgi:transposase-like protein
MVGTIFHRSHTELTKWFYAIYLFTTTRHGVAAKELERQLGVSYPTAFRMAHLIRQHMGMNDGDPTLGGHVEADETYMGGRRKGLRGRGATGKAVVLGMAERGGNIVTRHIPRASKAEIFDHITNSVEPESTISTDEWRGYETLNKEGYRHGTVCHGKGQWRSGPHHTNTLEGYWSLLKRSILGTHVHVSRKHLAKYLDEFEFRYNLRHSPQAMFDRLVLSL